ncbi:hypothetical protein [Listeria farberi]|uniref:Uncharacterized protein n=1 Tax=Listeria farberi TaxID=2713500 RepID=A0A7X0ZIL6_9LIST|nr:hypothetical protein [Listeria farberi]MBC1375781.1 hypothetical protein [Listeria farberi]MBC1382200.1 hypothetical protein [Listeria farberi]MBC2287821.1 hypothetical protein [Listeria farberi]
MERISNLWDREELLIKNGIHFSSGTGLEVDINYYATPSIKIGSYFDFLEVYKKDYTNVTHIDIFNEMELASGCYCCIGEGSHGSEGFVAYLDADKNLLWVLYSEASNPFVRITEEYENIVVAESSANFKVRIDVNNPTSLSLI